VTSRVAECAACGSRVAPGPLYAHLVRCPDCGFASYPVENEIDFASLYDDGYFKGFEYVDYLGQQAALRRSMRRHLTQMSKYTELGGSLLEVGSAYGFFLDEARRFFDPVIGVDIAENAVDYARSVVGVDAIVSDFPAMTLEPQTFNCVCMWDTIEHVPSPELFIAKAFEVLKPGGHVFLTTGDLGSWLSRFQGAGWRQIHPPTHLSYFTRPSLERMLTTRGFVIRGVETAPYYHTLYNILATLQMRDGTTGRLAGVLLRTLPRRLIDLGLWVDLRDILFVAAQKPLNAVPFRPGPN